MRVNWAAVGVAGVVYWIFQAAWFTVFMQPWQAGLHMTPEEIAAMRAHPDFWPYLIALVCNLVLAFLIARVLAIGGVWTLVRGFRIGLIVGLAAAAAMLTELHFEARPHPFVAVSAGAPLAGCILMGLIVGIWKPRRPSAETPAASPAGGI
jgi:hypothetical protein